MHHGYGNLEKAIKLMNIKDKNDFYDYVKKVLNLIPTLCIYLNQRY